MTAKDVYYQWHDSSLSDGEKWQNTGAILLGATAAQVITAAGSSGGPAGIAAAAVAGATIGDKITGWLMVDKENEQVDSSEVKVRS